MRMGYGLTKMQFSSAIEYRRDNAEQLDRTHTETTTWLFRNNFKFATDARLAPYRQAGPLGQ